MHEEWGECNSKHIWDELPSIFHGIDNGNLSKLATGRKSRAKPTMRLFLGQIPHSSGGAVFGDIKFHIRALHGRDYTSQGGDKTCFGEGRWGKGFTSSFT